MTKLVGVDSVDEGISIILSVSVLVMVNGLYKD